MLAKYIAMTPLDKPLKRALNIKGRDYVISLSPDSLKITEKGHRLGLELKWAELISGESALAVKASGNSPPASKKRTSMKRSRRR